MKFCRRWGVLLEINDIGGINTCKINEFVVI